VHEAPLDFGATGDEVAVLQEVLHGLGYFGVAGVVLKNLAGRRAYLKIMRLFH
jgi:hypothetical protein